MASNAFLGTDAKPAKKINLLDDSGSDDEEGGASLAAPQLKVNEEYARKFEHNKKREERQRLEEKYKSQKGAQEDDSDSESSSDSETEDEDGFLATEDLDAQISATLSAIKNKDPRVRDKDFSFFKADPEAAAAPTNPPQKKEKPLRLKDYHREKILAGDVGASDDEDEDKEDGKPRPQTYAEEQQDLQKSIVSEINRAAAGGDASDVSSDDDDDFVKRKASAAKPGQDGVYPSRAKTVNKVSDTDMANADRDPDTFLSNFMSARAWVAPGADGRNWQAFESDDDDEAAAAAEDRADEFEQAYNMRFEDPQKSNEFLTTYARDITAARSVRRDEATGRKRQRQLEKEAKEAAKAERKEERARLRRLKVEEAEEKLRKIKKAAGLRGVALQSDEWVHFLSQDWEDDKWEQEMAKRFGEDYYAEAEVASDSDDEDGDAKKKKKVKKPKWDDDIDINDIIPDFEDKEEAKFSLSDDEAQAGAGADDEEREDEEDSDPDAPPSKKRKTATDHKKVRLAARKAAKAERAQIEALVNARMDVDGAEVTPADDPELTFRYRETSPQSFGMTARDILLAPSDAALNNFAGLKKLATFRDAEKKQKDRKRLGKKARLREWRRDTFGRQFERTGPTFGFDGLVKEEQAKQKKKEEEKKAAGGGDDADGEVQKKKRKRSRGKKAQSEGGAPLAEEAGEDAE
ncbi:Protein KRI1 like protein [Verticillium longisporum]|uniref:Protein KRI1 like protein n=1 Tax=Verticillium longisporum TaxID=100787 RepID=A0A8I2ZZP2_VERLO|nr:Protein KRI1 like protein [Verticillium longisporum]